MLDVGRFRQLALTWTGDLGGDLHVRIRSGQGWAAWQLLEAVDHRDASEGNGRRGTDLLWVGEADRVQVRVVGPAPRDLQLVAIDPGVLASDSNPEPDIAPGEAGEKDDELVLRSATRTGAPRPALHGRGKWGANESWRNSEPRYCHTIKQAHIHHTASSNRYSRSDVPAIIRGIYRYHTHSLGWSDIGYNFLVDRFGRIWVGRAGGYNRPVRGAHTLGFNYNSVGVAVIGSYGSRYPINAVISALVHVTAWKLGAYGRDPGKRYWVRSQGSDRYPARKWARLWAVDGHRDTNYTACPGDRVYNRLPEIRDRARRRILRYS